MLGRSAGKKGSNQRYQVNVAFGLCQGPVSFTGASYGSGGNNRIWSNGGIAAGLGAVGLNGYVGNDGQDPDPVFLSADPNTPIWQLVILPAEPGYCRATPQEA